jgi:hypothetical protein
MSKLIEASIRRRDMMGCAVMGSLGVLFIYVLILWRGVSYPFEDELTLYSVATHNVMARFNANGWYRPLEYLILVVANKVYLPLWLAASLLCVVGATVLSVMACERLFECQISKSGWWALGIANPLLFYLVSTPGTVSQCLCNLFFAGAILSFISELASLRVQQCSSWAADRIAVSLNFMAAALFFTKETAVAAGVLLPAATALVRLKTRQFSGIFFISLLFPMAAAGIWTLIKLQLPLSRYFTTEGHYGLRLNPIAWGENIFTTLAFPLTPLPSSFIAFDFLRFLWVGFAVGSVALFMRLLVREAVRRPKILIPLLVVAGSCAPMILLHSSELYSTMIGPFLVSIVFVFGSSKKRLPCLIYALLLYAASVGNAMVYCLGADFNPLGLHRLKYSIYSKESKQDPACVIGTTAHVGWDRTAPNDPIYYPGVNGRITCVW